LIYTYSKHLNNSIPNNEDKEFYFAGNEGKKTNKVVFCTQFSVFFFIQYFLPLYDIFKDEYESSFLFVIYSQHIFQHIELLTKTHGL